MPAELDLREAYTLTREAEHAAAQARAAVDILERCGTTVTALVQRVRERDDYIRMLESRLVELAVPVLDLDVPEPAVERPRLHTSRDVVVATNEGEAGAVAVELRHDLDPAKVTVFHRGGTYRLLDIEGH